MASSRRKAAPARKAKVSARKTVKSARKSVSAATSVKRPQLDRVRRTLDEVLPTPPSSLDLEQRGSAARSGRAEFENNRRKLGRVMSAGLTGGDVDANFENAYFSGDEAPGGDNPTPDQEVVDDIGKALGVEYNDNEELKSSDKVIERDRHRWELDPASSEDYKDRD
jgi:hypothetical protein